MKCCIVFDLDGTLIDSRLDLAAAVNSMRTSFELEPLQTERIVKFVGNGVSTLVRRAVADASIDFPEALRRMKKFYSDHLVDSTGLYPGVAQGLAALREKGCKLAVLTNKPEPPARRILELLGVEKYFERIIGGDGDYPLKPDPEALVALMRDFEVSPDETFMVGDSDTDMETARRAGVRAIYAAYGFGDPREETFAFRAETFEDVLRHAGVR